MKRAIAVIIIVICAVVANYAWAVHMIVNRANGYVVVVRNDDHEFSTTEMAEFTYIKIPSVTLTEFRTIARNNKPEIKHVWSTGTVNWTEKQPQDRQAWLDGTQWRLVAEDIEDRPYLDKLNPSQIKQLESLLTSKSVALRLLTNNLTYAYKTDPGSQEAIVIE